MSKTESKQTSGGPFKSVAKTAKIMTLISKKRVEISMIRRDIHRNYTKLGKIFYKDYITDEEPDDAQYDPICEEISDCFRRINTLKKEIKDLNDDFFGRKVETANDLDDVEIIEVEPIAAEEDIFEEPPVQEEDIFEDDPAEE